MNAEHHLLQANGWVPNNPLLPAILYRSALPPAAREDMARAFEARFASNGWPPQWRNGVFDYHHYHSTAHEALGIAAGSARLILGGPNGLEIEVKTGDALLLPVGVGHCRIEQSADFWVVGAYPRGQSFDIRRSAPSPEQLAAMADVAFPDSDPVQGVAGPLTRLWRRT